MGGDSNRCVGMRRLKVETTLGSFGDSKVNEPGKLFVDLHKGLQRSLS